MIGKLDHKDSQQKFNTLWQKLVIQNEVIKQTIEQEQETRAICFTLIIYLVSQLAMVM